MKDFINGKITPWEFREQYWNQRNKDVSEDIAGGVGEIALGVPLAILTFERV